MSYLWLDVPVSVSVFFSQASDYPLDLYYILDQSNSMESYRLKLIELGRTLSETMRNISSNFRMGFGSFVDKTLTPFTNEAQEYCLPFYVAVCFLYVFAYRAGNLISIVVFQAEEVKQ